MRKVIGITGKFGSGKSYIAKYISTVSGIKLINFDDIVCEIANRPVVKRLVEKRINGKVPDSGNGIQLFGDFINIQKTFTKLEQCFLHYLCNRELKKILKNIDEDLIIDYVALPMLKVAKKFSASYLVESDNNIRIERLAKRENCDINDATRADKIMDIVNFKKLSYDKVFYNDYEKLPKGVTELAENLRHK